jgi:hypothetical protein
MLCFHDYSAQWDGEKRRRLDQQSQTDKARCPEVLEDGERLHYAASGCLSNEKPSPGSV